MRGAHFSLDAVSSQVPEPASGEFRHARRIEAEVDHRSRRHPLSRQGCYLNFAKALMRQCLS